MVWFDAPYFSKQTKAAPLAVFRISFGLMMLASIIRFWAKGWIEKLYIEPTFFFSYYGFEWVKPLGNYTYLLFVLCGLAALCVALGYHYRISIIVFFLTFTYIELMDKTTYLNHYYFISLLSFLMIFLPAEKYFSIDARHSDRPNIPKWSIDSIKLLIGIVYFYAGLAKLNSDWLLEAMPLKIWLPARFDLPLLGTLLQQPWVIYSFSWTGAIYDLSIPFLLLWKPTRPYAFGLVVIFHVLTRVLFPIGMFPYIMIVSALIFFDANVHAQILDGIKKIWMHVTSRFEKFFPSGKPTHTKGKLAVAQDVFLQENESIPRWKLVFLTLFFAVQILLPWRYLLYPGELFWTEQGFRFSWRVMLMEKAGHTTFNVLDKCTKNGFEVINSDFLTPFQEKQMSFQPDFILEFAHYLKDHFEKQGMDVAIFAESHVALNGRRSKPYIDSQVDLTQQKESFKPKTWILPLHDEIKGL